MVPLISSLALAALMITASNARASTIEYGVTGTTSGPVHASATFTTGANTVDISLQNLEPNITDVAQAISDLVFTLSGIPTGTASIASSSGLERSVASGGSFTDGSTVAPDWGFSTSGATLTLNDLAGGAAGPTHLILGPPDGSGSYSAANGSIAANPAHNPFLIGSVDWTLTVPGVSDTTTISGATFSFGTTDGQYEIPGTTPTPEPGGIALVAIGLVAVGLVIRKRGSGLGSPQA